MWKLKEVLETMSEKSLEIMEKMQQKFLSEPTSFNADQKYAAELTNNNIEIAKHWGFKKSSTKDRSQWAISIIINSKFIRATGASQNVI